MAMPEFVADSVTDSVFRLKLWRSLFFAKLQAFTMNGNDRVCDKSAFNKASVLSDKLESILINGSDEVCARACFA